MATNAITVVAVSRGAYRARWLFVSGVFASGDVGQAFDAPHLPDKSVWVDGPTGGTTAVVIEGPNEPQAATSSHPTGPWQTLHSAAVQGATTLSFTDSGVDQILENTLYVRPRLETATGGQSITVVITAQSGRR